MKHVIVFAKLGKKRSFYTGRRDEHDKAVIVTDPDEGLVYATYGCARADFAHHAGPIAKALGAHVSVAPVETERELIAGLHRARKARA